MGADAEHDNAPDGDQRIVNQRRISRRSLPDCSETVPKADLGRGRPLGQFEHILRADRVGGRRGIRSAGTRRNRVVDEPGQHKKQRHDERDNRESQQNRRCRFHRLPKLSCRRPDEAGVGFHYGAAPSSISTGRELPLDRKPVPAPMDGEPHSSADSGRFQARTSNFRTAMFSLEPRGGFRLGFAYRVQCSGARRFPGNR